MKNKGFTLIELMVTIFLIAVGVVGAFAVLQKVTISTSISSSRLVASYLAQEGIEIVRNIRDTNWVESDPFGWRDGLIDCSSIYSSDGCEVDYDDSALVDYQDRYLKISGGGFYNYDSGSETKFKRRITIDTLVEFPGMEYMEVTAQVTWEWAGRTHSVSVQETLYNWFRLE